MAKNAGAEGPAVSFEWVAAPDDLHDYVNSLYILRVGDCDVEEMMPAYSGQLCLVIRGGGEMTFIDGTQARTTKAYFLTPLTVAQPFSVEANTIALGISLNVRGWACFTGLPADEVKDGFRSAEEVLDAEAVDRLHAAVSQINAGSMDEAEGLQIIADVVRTNLTPLSARHELIVSRTLEWLSSSFKPDIEDLRDALPYSERQMQRLVSRFFAQTPVRLIRRFRAIRAATLLTMDGLGPAMEAEIRDAFYDQAHMIKEIRYFTGKTPRRLRPQVDSVVRETLGEPGYGTVDLFGGKQNEELGKGAT